MNTLKVLLVNMPWQSLDYPSLALSLLKVLARRSRVNTEVAEYYGNLDWAEHLLTESGGRLTPRDYYAISDNGMHYGVGDWIFTSALYRQGDWNLDDYVAFLRSRPFDSGPTVDMHRLAPAFVAKIAARIARQDLDVVGFTSTFMQNVSSLALAAELKRLRPDITTVFGGGNCDGAQGEALHRNYDFLDYVLCGEGERSFPQLLDSIAGLADPSAVPGLCWRAADGNKVNRPDSRLISPQEIPSPEADGYFQALEASAINGWVEPKLVLESARGCWWGERHQCTFCGLNGSFMKYRAKPSTVVWAEIEDGVTRHQTLDVVMVDNILDMSYFSSLIPRMKAAGWDLRLHYEVKSNLRKEQVTALREAGVVHVQPGIESLNSRVLRLMDKGVTGAQNVQVLRDCEEQGLTVSWNYLYGFPGETDDDYWSVIEQLPALTHLQPPAPPTRIAVHRFSPYFEQPTLGFSGRVPAEFYRLIYDLDEGELEDLVYLFDSPPAGASDLPIAALRDAIERWITSYSNSSLTLQRLGGRLLIRDARENWPRTVVELDDPREISAYLELTQHHRTLPDLSKRLTAGGVDVSQGWLVGWADTMKKAGLLFHEASRWVALAVLDTGLRIRAEAPQ